MGIFDRRRARRLSYEISHSANGSVITATINGIEIDKDKALQIPALKASLNLIKSTVREIPIKLYRKEEDKVFEIQDDDRTYLLNIDTGDSLNASQFWDAMIEDYFLEGQAYAYLKRRYNDIRSIHYIDQKDISYNPNNEQIFKDYAVLVGAGIYDPSDFLKIVKDTKNGGEGVGIVEENQLLLKTQYNLLMFEKILVSTGGNKKGFLLSKRPLSEKAMASLKKGFKELYSNNTENFIILNEGMDFKESSNSAVEMQLASIAERNNLEIFKLFNIPPGMMDGAGTKGGSEDDKKKFLDYCIIPFLKTITTALNRDLLLESEKKRLFFSFDLKDIQKGSLLERMQAYEIAARNNFMLVDEIRKTENLEALGYKFLNLGLSSVLYNPGSGKILVPNTGQTFDFNNNLLNEEKSDGNTDQNNGE